MANVLKKVFGFLFNSDQSSNADSEQSSDHQSADQKWWLEIKTASPACTYYFGPFDAKSEAERQQSGYLEDLQQEGAKVLSAAAIALSSPPQQLTVYEDGMDGEAPDPKPVFSGQS